MMNKKTLFLTLLMADLILPIVASAEGENFCIMIKRLSSLTYQIGGTIVIIGWVIAGILWLVSGGSPEKTGIAKKAIWAAVIGTVLVVIAGISSSLIIDALGMNGAVPLCP